MQFGSVIKQLRKEKGLIQKEVLEFLKLKLLRSLEESFD